MSRELRFAILGTGYWSAYQLAAWQELEGVRCVALYNRTPDKARRLAEARGVAATVYDDAEAMLSGERLDFVDIITDPSTHPQFVALAARHKLPVICQKPMADSLGEARRMAAACREAGVPLYIHENWRWQRQVRALKDVLDEGRIGRVFRARVQYSNSFPVFDNQPFLKRIERFILMDIGTHILDTARFLFGEAAALCCQTRRVHTDIRGEDVATVMLRMADGATVVCEMSYASRMEHELFPQTYVTVEGDEGSVSLDPDYWVRVTTAAGTHARRYPPPRYAWADPAYGCIHAAIAACNADILGAMRTGEPPETDADDNLRTLELVEAAYESARRGAVVEVAPGGGPATDSCEDTPDAR